MHPPLDRPHPDCQTEINALQTCHATTSKLKFWACNDVKFQLDKCLKEEKLRLLDQMNKDVEKRRQLEEDAYQKALGKDVSFEEYLKGDREYQRAVEEGRRARNEGGA
mmetsp:Transcript_11200/g.23613  ORF Transcript_11200/g.23613 Transcript_11200/m.23613 type:complete len:108 (-) Transcript_11200:515-838(-)|eukprot:CAMPEP_0171339052 /NCGR_PEP_ID=MMETSP0878-20121228/7711_1 /TAXON_ID=67004 /ORGANISM="Thalassiosira weissflogii, Strain CCMP1336" /LENGTH=107 /DNA_ID=CAMNT_0011840913 /DNA_START=129 /DNA_END=452 /DNA_ORIENTATION=+